jgi:hypothetical protein
MNISRLADSDNLPAPGVIAHGGYEIVEDLQAGAGAVQSGG